jgi:hypothetical protein
MAGRDQYHYRWFASVYPNSLHIYQREIDGRTGGSAYSTYHDNFSSNDTEGIISKKAAKRIERSVVWLLYYAKPKKIHDVLLNKTFSFLINFITLTLPAKQIHSDDEIKKRCLNNFLDVCRKEYGLANYVWKAEAQINGNIHFHLVTDCYIRYDNIQRIWNQSVDLLTAPEGHEERGMSYIDRFEQKIGHRNPNSTDVHSVKHVRKIASYISKYMSKNRAFHCIGELREHKGKRFEILYGSDEYRLEEGGQKVGKVVGNVIAGPVRRLTGRQWFLSRSLSQCKAVKINEDEHEFKDLSTIIQKGGLHQFNTDFCFNYYGKVDSTCKKFAPWLSDMIRNNREFLEAEKQRQKELKTAAEKETAETAGASRPLPSIQRGSAEIQGKLGDFS